MNIGANFVEKVQRQNKGADIALMSDLNYYELKEHHSNTLQSATHIHRVASFGRIIRSENSTSEKQEEEKEQEEQQQQLAIQQTENNNNNNTNRGSLDEYDQESAERRRAWGLDDKPSNKIVSEVMTFDEADQSPPRPTPCSCTEVYAEACEMYGCGTNTGIQRLLIDIDVEHNEYLTEKMKMEMLMMQQQQETLNNNNNNIKINSVDDAAFGRKMSDVGNASVTSDPNENVANTNKHFSSITSDTSSNDNAGGSQQQSPIITEGQQQQQQLPKKRSHHLLGPRTGSLADLRTTRTSCKPVSLNELQQVLTATQALQQQQEEMKQMIMLKQKEQQEREENENENNSSSSAAAETKKQQQQQQQQHHENFEKRYSQLSARPLVTVFNVGNKNILNESSIRAVLDVCVICFPNLTRLIIGDVGLTESSVKVLCSAVEKLQKLVSIDLSGNNKLFASSARMLVDIVEKTPRILEVRLETENIPKRIVSALKIAIATNTAIYCPVECTRREILSSVSSNNNNKINDNEDIEFQQLVETSSSIGLAAVQLAADVGKESFRHISNKLKFKVDEKIAPTAEFQDRILDAISSTNSNSNFQNNNNNNSSSSSSSEVKHAKLNLEIYLERLENRRLFLKEITKKFEEKIFSSTSSSNKNSEEQEENKEEEEEEAEKKKKKKKDPFSQHLVEDETEQQVFKELFHRIHSLLEPWRISQSSVFRSATLLWHEKVIEKQNAKLAKSKSGETSNTKSDDENKTSSASASADETTTSSSSPNFSLLQEHETPEASLLLAMRLQHEQQQEADHQQDDSDTARASYEQCHDAERDFPTSNRSLGVGAIREASKLLNAIRTKLIVSVVFSISLQSKRILYEEKISQQKQQQESKNNNNILLSSSNAPTRTTGSPLRGAAAISYSSFSSSNDDNKQNNPNNQNNNTNLSTTPGIAQRLQDLESFLIEKHVKFSRRLVLIHDRMNYLTHEYPSMIEECAMRYRAVTPLPPVATNAFLFSASSCSENHQTQQQQQNKNNNNNSTNISSSSSPSFEKSFLNTKANTTLLERENSCVQTSTYTKTRRELLSELLHSVFPEDVKDFFLELLTSRIVSRWNSMQDVSQLMAASDLAHTGGGGVNNKNEKLQAVISSSSVTKNNNNSAKKQSSFTKLSTAADAGTPTHLDCIAEDIMNYQKEQDRECFSSHLFSENNNNNDEKKVDLLDVVMSSQLHSVHGTAGMLPVSFVDAVLPPPSNFSVTTTKTTKNSSFSENNKNKNNNNNNLEEADFYEMLKRCIADEEAIRRLCVAVVSRQVLKEVFEQ